MKRKVSISFEDDIMTTKIENLTVVDLGVAIIDLVKHIIRMTLIQSPNKDVTYNEVKKLVLKKLFEALEESEESEEQNED